MKLAHVVLVGSLFLAASCVSLPVPGQRATASQERLTSKVVLEKREPNLLIASERSECVVSRERFDRVREGQGVFCHWR